MQGPRAYWTGLPRAADAATVAEAARRAEARGYRGVVGTQVYGPPWAQLAVAAAATTTLEIASGIAMAFVRSPFETACAALDLDHLAGGRFTLGLGAAPKYWTERYFGTGYEPPIGRMGEVIDIVRRVEEAARARRAPEPFAGRFYDLDFVGLEPTAPPRRAPLPVWVAALRERLCELAGAKADGLIGHPVWSMDWTLGPAMDALARGAASAGRDPASVHLQLWVTASIDRDPAEAVRRARGNMAFYGGIAQYRPFFAAHGFGEVVDRLIDARRSLPVAGCVELVPDAMARTFVLCGDRDHVAGQIERLWGRADSMVVRPPSWGVDPNDYATRVAELETILLGPA
jgi:alkanesulfonate monooxygenase SsuD/methylene tetrahydromethanopterin reductase-like flavin-dependent oxidoreductase (luciferase family)